MTGKLLPSGTESTCSAPDLLGGGARFVQHNVVTARNLQFWSVCLQPNGSTQLECHHHCVQSWFLAALGTSTWVRPFENAVLRGLFFICPLFRRLRANKFAIFRINWHEWCQSSSPSCQQVWDRPALVWPRCNDPGMRSAVCHRRRVLVFWIRQWVCSFFSQFLSFPAWSFLQGRMRGKWDKTREQPWSSWCWQANAHVSVWGNCVQFLVRGPWVKLNCGFGTRGLPKEIWPLQPMTRSAVADPDLCAHRKTLTKSKISWVRTAAGASEELLQTELCESVVFNILRKDLCAKKRSACVVPQTLTPLQKETRAQLCDENLQRWHQDPDNFLSSVITCDETWLSTFEMETKRQSAVWLEPGQERPTKARTNGWAKKTMLTLFFDEMGVVWMEFMPPKTTITSAAFIETLRRFKEAVRKKRPKLWAPSNGNRHTFLLHMDNASPHTAAPTETKMTEWGIWIVSHPPYSPDLALCDYSIFPKLKERLRGVNFDSVQDLQDRARLELSRMPKPTFAQAISDSAEMSDPSGWLFRREACPSGRGTSPCGWGIIFWRIGMSSVTLCLCNRQLVDSCPFSK